MSSKVTIFITECIIEINKTQTYNAKYLDVSMPFEIYLDVATIIETD